jgi:hypothetical protein
MPDETNSESYRYLDQTKDLENITTTLRNRCNELESDLAVMRERYASSSFDLILDLFK